MEERIWHQHYDYNVLTSYRFPRIPLQALLDIPCNAYPDKPAIHYYGSETTFWELRETAVRLANAFSDLGVKKGDRVGLHLPNIPQYLISYYATLYVGAVVVNFNPLYTLEELTALVKQTGVSTFITFDMVVPNVKALTAEVAIPRVIATSVFDFMDGVDISTPETLQMETHWHHFSQLLDSSQILKRPKIETSIEDAAMIQFTGGTTGIPKGALLIKPAKGTGIQFHIEHPHLVYVDNVSDSLGRQLIPVGPIGNNQVGDMVIPP